MTNRALKHELNRERSKRVHYWGLLTSVTSLLYGWFILTNDGYLLTHSESYFQGMSEKLFAYGLLTFGAIKLIGVMTNNRHLKKWGIIGLSALWGALFVLALTYSFGSGRPHPSWIFSLHIVLTCWRISLKGEFDGL